MSIDQCLDLTTANLELIQPSDPTASAAAGKKVSSFGPPADVQSAIDYLVVSGGITADDMATVDAAEVINEWIEGACDL